MRNPIGAMTIASAISVLLGAIMLGCPGGGTTPGPTGGAGGEGGGQGGSGGAMTACKDGDTQSCYSGAAGTEGVGSCKPGTATCVNGQWGACKGEVLPATEACDVVDNDCNGQVDDLPAITCGKGICEVMVAGCVDGKVPECVPGEAQTEVCGGGDEDCDGEVDEGDVCPCTDGTTQDCYTGNPTTKGVGECKTGTQNCVNGSWGTCEGEVLPSAETCDTLDNDCNGTKDDNIPKLTCGSGACAVTTPACVNGMQQTCTPGTSKPETCNGIDDDCNFFIDDGLGSKTCGTGACAATVPNCINGVPQVCKEKMPQAEICDDLDNDCDGQVNEGNPGGGVVCNTGLQGACSVGTLNCVNNALKCTPNNTQVPDTCDGLDNDCDGTVDENNPGGGVGCDVPGKFGPCKSGVTSCSNGGIVCTQTNMPGMEVCDSVDNDCDGAADENTSVGMCNVPGKMGVCAVGTNSCVMGQLTCPQITFPAANESCNNADDDCDGQVDEGNPGGGGACSVPGKQGPCANGTQNCTNGMLQCTQTTFPTNMEVCNDMIDNDCNGAVNDNCCAHSVCQSGVPLPQGCIGGGTCTTDVCTINNGVYSYCCTTNWDNTCALVANLVCTGTCCAHGQCTVGSALNSTCDSCTAAICAAKPFCCNSSWNEVCIDRVPLYCGGSTGTYCTSGCSHSVCELGNALVSGCNTCATAVCNARPSCCGAGGGTWDQTCINDVATKCTAQFSCN